MPIKEDVRFHDSNEVRDRLLFHSMHFLLFFPLVVAAYYTVPPRARALLLLGASYYFYACWKAMYLWLIVGSTVVDYIAGLRIEAARTQARRRAWLLVSLSANLGILLIFKYFDFFAAEFQSILGTVGLQANIPTLQVLLPVGISFYTFQTMSYTIDVFKRARPAERNLIRFATYVSFFPQLVAGPIERSTHLLPQFLKTTSFDYDRTVSGLRRMCWGFFKKLVIADTLAGFVDPVFTSPEAFQGPTLLFGSALFAMQIYCDFSGYSDIAIGAARILGFDLMENFRRPYFAQSIGDFWSRWHISLSQWFRDYVYLPLGGNRCKKTRWCINVSIVFLLSGLWHGASWTFVAWGGLHASYYLCGRLTQPLRQQLLQLTRLSHLPRVHAAVRMAFTFFIVVVAWVFFRAASIEDAVYMIRNFVSGWDQLTNVHALRTAFGYGASSFDLMVIAAGLAILMIVQVLQSRGSIGLRVAQSSALTRWSLYYGGLTMILLFGKFGGEEFMYFQF